MKEIEEALLAGQVDVGVHSLKDMPSELPAALILGAFPAARGPARRAARRGARGDGTRCPRARWWGRRARGAARWCSRAARISGPSRSAATWTRGSRSSRAGAYDALIMAAAGLKRLGLTPAARHAARSGEFVPAVGQGVLAVEARERDRELLELLRALDDTRTRLAALAERAFLARLGAGCHTPVAAHARAGRRDARC